MNSHGPTSGKHSKDQRERLSIIERLGGACVDCGVKERLELDHVVAAKWKPRTLSPHQRILEYRKQLEADNLAVRCSTRNKAKRRTNGEF